MSGVFIGGVNGVVEEPWSRRAPRLPFMTMLAAFYVLLYRYSRQDDLVIGTTIAGRNQAEVEGLIGLFLNTLVLRARISDNVTFRDLLASVRNVTIEAYANQNVPFEKLLEELKAERDLSRTPLFQVFFDMLSFPEYKIDLPGLEAEIAAPPEIGSKFDLTLYVEEKGGKFKLDLVYDCDLFTAERAEEMLEQYTHLLERIASNPGEQVSTLFARDSKCDATPARPLGAI